MLNHPFKCEECDPLPAENFAIYTPTDDWLIAFPEKNLVHVHFGESSHDDKSNIEESRFHLNWVMDLLKKYPNKHFFWIVDTTRKDDSEFFVKEARDNLQKIRTHPQMPKGAAYGFTWAMRMVISLLNLMGGTAVLVDSPEAARQEYKKWKATYSGK